MKSVLFVCLGNICRSPMAEGIFNSILKKGDLQDRFRCDSCGVSDYHVGELPDQRAQALMQEKGITLTHRARQISPSDFDRFDYILVMDQDNYREVMSIARTQTDRNKVCMMRAFDSEGSKQDVPDPYYGGDEGFENVYQLLQESCEGFLRQNPTDS